VPGDGVVQINHQFLVSQGERTEALDFVPTRAVCTDRDAVEIGLIDERNGRRSVRFIANVPGPESENDVGVAGEVEPERQFVARVDAAGGIQGE
jgi:hypothetical protein